MGVAGDQLNILLVCIGSAGDVHPFVGIGRWLRDRGHRVTVITSAYFENLIRAQGLGFEPISTADDFLQLTRDPNLWHKSQAWKPVFSSILGERLRQVYQKIEQLHQPGRTILVASSLALAARCASEKLNIPLATVHLAPVVLRGSHNPPKLGGLWMPRWLPMFVKQGIWNFGDTHFVDPHICPSLNAFRAEIGLPAVSKVLADWWNSPQLVLGLWPEFFGPMQPDWPAQVRLTGFPLYDEADVSPIPTDIAHFLDTGDPPIVFTAGSAMFHAEAYFAAATDTCRIMGRRGLLVTKDASQLPAALPDSVRHVSYSPFSKLFPRAAAVVHHGGIGTTAQALAAGVPQLVMPWAHDQFDNADRVRKLGAGRVFNPRRFRPWAVAKVLESLLKSTEIRDASVRVSRNFAGGDPLGKTCEQILQLNQFNTTSAAKPSDAEFCATKIA